MDVKRTVYKWDLECKSYRVEEDSDICPVQGLQVICEVCEYLVEKMQKAKFYFYFF